MIILRNNFITAQESQEREQKEKTNSFLFYFGLFVILGSFILETLINLFTYSSSNYNFLVMLNYTIVFSIVVVLLVLYFSHISTKKYIAQSPTEWLDSFDNTNSIVPTKFESFFNRTFLIDKDKFTLISNTEGYIFIIFVMMFLIIGLIVGAYPYIISPDFKKYTKPSDYPKPFAFFFILIIAQIGFWIKYKNETRWTFTKISSNQISFSITNDPQRKIKDRSDKMVLSNLEMNFVLRHNIYPKTKINRFFRKNIESWFLFINLPSYLKNVPQPNDRFFLFENPAKECTESINDVFLKWLNYDYFE